MVTITEEQWGSLLGKLEEGEDKADIIEILLNQGYTLFEAEAIYLKLEQANRKRLDQIRLEKKSLRHRLNSSPVIVLLLSVIGGILLPLVYYAGTRFPFSILWGVPWMMYVFGNWLLCLGSGNLPAFFQNVNGTMAAECTYLNASTLQKVIALIGGLAFILIIGSLLVIYMVHVTKRIHKDKTLEDKDKRWRYVTAFMNGLFGFSMLTAGTYAFQAKVKGELAIDLASSTALFADGGANFLSILSISIWAVWIIAAGIVILMMAKK